MCIIQGHIGVGQGDFTTNLAPHEKGTIEDVAASPNDPLFILHHTMVDCVFEEWLKRHPDGEYPSTMDVPQGHLRDGYMVPFFPLYTNNDMFKGAENFGYSCILSDLEDSHAIATLTSLTWPIALVVAVVIATFKV